MLSIRAAGTLCVLLLFTTSVFAQAERVTNAENQLKEYINYVVHQVKDAEDPEKKRAILNEAFNNLDLALTRVKSMQGIAGIDQEFIAEFKKDIRSKQNELNGLDGFEKVLDHDLNKFADFVQQDLEQSRTVVTISITTLLLAAILLVLLVR